MTKHEYILNIPCYAFFHQKSTYKLTIFKNFQVFLLFNNNNNKYDS